MADEIPPVPEHTRKTVSLTHRQLGFGGAIVAAIMTLNPIKEMFYTREEGVAQVQRSTAIEATLTQMENRLSAQITNGNANIVQLIKDSESRANREGDKLEGRINSLEMYALRLETVKKKSN